MKIKFLLLALFYSAVCYGQVLYSEKGVSLSYDGNQFIRTEYRKECDVTFDVYRVKGTIKNNNTDKAVSSISGSELYFKGDKCSWYEGHYKIMDETYSTSLVSPVWFQGVYVNILPGKELALTGEVKVVKGTPCPQPKFRMFFTFVTLQEQTSQPNQTQSIQNIQKPQWSEWRSISGCATGLEYRMLKDKGFNLNYQVHLYFEVKSSYNDDVRFDFNLLDKNSTVHFGNTHDVGGGGTVAFNHKMDSDKITSVQIKNAIFIKNGKSVCNSGNQNNSTNENNIKEERQTAVIVNQQNNSYVIAQQKKDEERLQREQQEELRQREEEQRHQQRIRKAQETRKAQFDGAIQKGGNAMISKQYDSAMSYYSLAKSYAQNSYESTFAQSKYNQAFESKKTAERQVRVQKQQEKDKKENLEYAGLATGVVGMMSLLNDGYSYKWYASKCQMGLGYENFPIYSNNVSQYHANNSYIESFILPTFHMGLKFGFFNNKGVSFAFNPILNAGFSALSAGTSGGYAEYGSTATLYLSPKSESKFKVFAEGGYFNRRGNYSYDADAARGGNSATDDVRKSTFKYDIMKYGGGFMYHLIYDGKETYVRPAIFFEKPSFFTKDDKPVLNFNCQVNISSEIIFDFSYSPDYFIGGDVIYPTTLQPEKKNYFSIKIMKQGKLY